MENIIIFFVLIFIGYKIGSTTEKKHYKSLNIKEDELINLPVVNGKKFIEERNVERSELVAGAVVIGQDYFKRVMSNLRNLFGGNMRAYETLLDRGRREAIVRMKENAKDADIILNMRIETSTIGFSAGKKSAGCIEVIAYGTALKYENLK